MALYDVAVVYGRVASEFGEAETFRVEIGATLDQIITSFADVEWVKLTPIDGTKRIVRVADIKMVSEVEEE